MIPRIDEFQIFRDILLDSLKRQKLNRILVAVLAVGCLLAGLLIGRLDSMENLWCGSFIRAGLLLGAFWIGMPTRGRAAAWANVSPWWVVGVVAGLILITRLVRRPQILIPFAAVLGFLFFVMPLFTSRRTRE